MRTNYDCTYNCTYSHIRAFKGRTVGSNYSYHWLMSTLNPQVIPKVDERMFAAVERRARDADAAVDGGAARAKPTAPGEGCLGFRV